MSPDQVAFRWRTALAENRAHPDLQAVRLRTRELFDAVNACESRQEIDDTIAGCMLQLVLWARAEHEKDIARAHADGKRLGESMLRARITNALEGKP